MRDPIETIYRAIETIEDNLENEVSVADIADSVGYSLFHFIRTFNRVVHHTPYDYLIRRRLSRAAHALTTSDRRIIDIAQDYGFSSQETFSRAFKRMFDVQPSQWRDHKLNVATLLMPPKTIADLEFNNREHFRYPVIETLQEKTLCGLMTALDSDELTRQRQRSRGLADLCCLTERPAQTQYVAVTSYVDPNWEKAYFFIGLEENGRSSDSSLMVTRMLPAGQYAKMHAAKAETRQALNYLYFTWFPKTGLKPTLKMEIELCPVEGCSSNQRAIYIPVGRAIA